MTAAAAVGPEERGGLLFPFGCAAPAPGAVREIAPGIHWLRMPLPFSLDHINLWLLDAGDHWALVDTGLATAEVRALWEACLAGRLSAKPLGRLIVTHAHPDHIGLAGWLAPRFGLLPEVARAEFLLARVLLLDAGGHPPEDVVAFYARHGWPEEAVSALRRAPWGSFARAVHPLPRSYRRLREGDRLAIGGRTFAVLTGAGHSPEHVCLWCREEAILIAGDQVLPDITSNVSVYPTEPEANPLADWLSSIARLRALLPADTLVLPAHGRPFRGLHARLDQLALDHRLKLDRLEGALAAAPRTAFETFGTLFRRPVGAGERQMATGEALAHLHYLEAEGRAERLAGPDGRIRFARR